jgi:aspartyl-tRNA(Asn)/glutamyl-tRNA(Gln) amidotransferase subunit A
MASLLDLSLTELRAALAAGTCSAREAADALLAAAEQGNPALNAYCHLDPERVRARAEAAQSAATGDALLGGLPIGIKDVLNVAGEPCRCASRMLDGYVSLYDATAVARLGQAGGYAAGRLNMDEFAMGSTNENSCYGPVRNPWQLDHVAGGSSGGSAAAVAGGIAWAALGSDTGGSVRQPASFCGVVGLKPGYGRISRYGLTAYASSLDQVGVLTRTVADAALLLQAIAGPDPLDSTSAPVEVPDFRAGLEGGARGLRLGVPAEMLGEGVDPEVRAAVRAAIDRLATEGAEVREVHLPHLGHAIATYYIVAAAEASANLARFDGVRYGARVAGDDPFELYVNSREAGFGPEVKRRILLGTYVLSSGYYDAYYLRAQKARTLICRDFEAAFRDCDALVGPVAPTPAYRLGENDADPLRMYLGDICTVPVNLAGLSALSVPCGISASGLPIGLQLIGPPFAEATLLRLGRAWEQISPTVGRRPAPLPAG